MEANELMNEVPDRKGGDYEGNERNAGVCS